MERNNYSDLTEYYRRLFDLFDTIHFNSSVAASIYNTHLAVGHSELLAITHSGIADNRSVRSFDGHNLHLIFIGSIAPYKGFPLLEEVLMELYSAGQRCWLLDVWGATGTPSCELIRYNGDFKPEELGAIFEPDSLLITPSLCNETFSLSTLEALSYGTPALVSSSVGAKDVVSQYDSWFIFTDKMDLRDKLTTLLQDRGGLRTYNRSIVNGEWRGSMTDHCREVMDLYRRTQQRKI